VTFAAILAAVTGVGGLAGAVTAVVIMVKTWRGVKEVHVLVNSTYSAAVARIETLEKTLIGADVPVPKAPGT
jgi:hydroxyethylthiazole kinase-like sugar kinase family protein